MAQVALSDDAKKLVNDAAGELYGTATASILNADGSDPLSVSMTGIDTEARRRAGIDMSMHAESPLLRPLCAPDMWLHALRTGATRGAPRSWAVMAPFAGRRWATLSMTTLP